MKCFYINEFTDEVMPCEPTLEGWAEWLSKPDASYGRSEAAKDGDTFLSNGNLEFGADIVATRHAGDEWTFSRPPEGHFLAVRFAQHMGWSPENIMDLFEESTPDEAMRAWFADNNNACEDQEFVVCGHTIPNATLTYRADPPRLEVEYLADETQPPRAEDQ